MSTRVTRGGEVLATNVAGVERRIGFVDRCDANGRPKRTWRAITLRGSMRGGFPRQADAVAYLTGERHA